MARYGKRWRVSSARAADVHAEASLKGHVALGLGLLRLGRDEDEVAVLPEARVDAELLLEALVRLDGASGQLDPDAVGVLVADAAAGQRRRAGADVVALHHHDAPGPAPRQVVGGAHAHDAGADDDDVGPARHGALPACPLALHPRNLTANRGEPPPNMSALRRRGTQPCMLLSGLGVSSRPSGAISGERARAGREEDEMTAKITDVPVRDNPPRLEAPRVHGTAAGSRRAVR